MILSVSSIGGAPGVTSWACLLAAAWPAEMSTDRVILEADTDGGVLGSRFGIGVEPGAPALISMMRRSNGERLELELVGRRIDDRVWVIPGPESAERSLQLWSGAGVTESIGDLAATDDRLWIVDVGRASAAGPLAPMLALASMSLVFTRAEHDALVQVKSRVAALARRGQCVVGVVVVGKPAFSDRASSRRSLGRTSLDRRGGPSRGRFVEGGVGERRVRRSLLWRSAVTVAADVAEVVLWRTEQSRGRGGVGE